MYTITKLIPILLLVVVLSTKETAALTAYKTGRLTPNEVNLVTLVLTKRINALSNNGRPFNVFAKIRSLI